MKIVAFSDSHTRHELIPDAAMKEADVLVIAGDICNRGTLIEVVTFKNWLMNYQHRYGRILFTPGNHDVCFEKESALACGILGEIPNLKILIDAEYTFEGVKFYGSPWQPNFCNWAFNLPRGAALKRHWDRIPDDVNVLITHGPPKGILDYCDGGNVGCKDLTQRLRELRQRNDLELHLFGHIHESRGQMGIYHNCSVLDGAYEYAGDPYLLEI